MKKVSILKRVNPETKRYILDLAKIEQQWYENYINNNNICEDEEIYNKKSYINHPHDKAIKNILSDKQEVAILINEILELEGKAEIKPNEIAKCKLNEKEKSYLSQYIIYFIGNKYGENEKDKILNKINKNVKEEKSMLSDVLDQIEERGIKKGERRGIIKSKKAIVINMLKNNYNDKEIRKISEVTDKELEKIKESLKIK
ncbi:MAG: hypothetical protein ACI4VQ_04550 [Clostridia bacterium]